MFQTCIALVTASVLGGAQPVHAAENDPPLPVTITNNSGRHDALYLYVVGTDLGHDDRRGHLNSTGTFTSWPQGKTPPIPAPDASIPGPADGGSITLMVPRNFAGRVYMAFGDKLQFFLTTGGLVEPAPWTASDPNHGVLLDWSELTYDSGGLWLNSSQVDQFAIPHVVAVTSQNGSTRRAGELVPDGRHKIVESLNDQPGWGRLAQRAQDGSVLRVLSPARGTDADVFDPRYLDGYIERSWAEYAAKPLVVTPFTSNPAIRFTGRTQGDVLSFTDVSGRRVAEFRKPSTMEVWRCDGALAAPNDDMVGPIARTLCAALHRSTLESNDLQPSGTSADFYKGTVTDHYSRVIHENMADGRAYGFAFDDVLAQESIVHDATPHAAGITITPLTVD
ncbi:beta-1,3-glucanase family protein [Lentzea sp. NEAU-D7]|uniref:beta-1,3-glucanase family protein n=1 Tax=Lentzea sp. NEAU-D7 TaxID=2994667 RepID=UPI00224AEF61|nr:beta-1,3-glucanase family protein [Lentzea sp. NEAU-D7]MCX2954554.1 beta-1,3-glucanase family protein [Lentzea sp. NEAU-D7]